MSEYQGEPELMTWLKQQGFRFQKQWPIKHDECNWIAYRQSSLPSRRCESNDDKEYMQIAIWPTCLKFNNGVVSRQVEVHMCGEAVGQWWLIQAYAIPVDDLLNNQEKLADIERRLIAAWNALVEPPNVN